MLNKYLIDSLIRTKIKKKKYSKYSVHLPPTDAIPQEKTAIHWYPLLMRLYISGLN